MSATMPPGKPSLAEAEYVNITAFILQFNGAPAGTQALTAATATPIGTIATGQRADDDRRPPVPAAVTARAHRRGRPVPRRRAVIRWSATSRTTCR